MKGYKNIYFLTVMVILLLLALWTWQAPSREFSENENRYLKDLPDFHFSAFADGSFQNDLEEGMKDQFPGRDTFMEASTIIKKWTGRREIGDCYLGDHGRYFARVTDQDISESRYGKNLEQMEKLAEDPANKSISFSSMLVPSSGIIYGEDLPAHAPIYDDVALMELAQEYLKNYKLIDVKENFMNKSKNIDLYYHTDHHWTLWGAYEAYLQWRENNLYSHKENFQLATDSFLGSLYSRTLDPAAHPDEIYLWNESKVPVTTDSLSESKGTGTIDSFGLAITADGKPGQLYDLDALEKKDKYQVYFGGNYGITEIDGGQGRGTMVVIKDSFANCFVPFLCQDFQRIVMIDLRYFPGNVKQVLQEEKPDQVLVLYELSNFAQDSNIAKLAIQ